ncbi:uncharacterized protein LACBIDRAFT_336103 [Laccaria bicolor S238N-H82]|uniref:Predicted protein n=1 Tax=Laccaria bicolor (strain S238N-H82 / ATCC MYA-4686) TaxID=486041 RepID=B0E4E3_LACBS|nr:uncharacterized protein LACBIDRAFT_336103 [Laccaria bicolor S238N-H82]EDQ98288.1 predicted protein [Laccaria bicolor S238N-H82]|eukprot:XP_001891061.1 predicted protein [Laccaria bicolor S238N-H82]
MDNREPRTTETETQSTTASTFCCTKLQLSNTLYASCIAMHTFLAILVDTGHSRRCKTQAKLGWVQRSSTIIRCTCYTLSSPFFSLNHAFKIFARPGERHLWNTLPSSLGCLENNPKHPRSLKVFGSLNPVPFTRNVNGLRRVAGNQPITWRFHWLLYYIRRASVAFSAGPTSQKLHSYTRSSTPPTINTPSEPPLITPERPNPLRPLLTNIAFCQLFAVCLSGNYKDPKYRLLHSFG